MLGCPPQRHIGKHFAGLLRTGMRLDDNARLSHVLVRPIRTSAPCSRLNLGDSSQQVAVLVRPNSGLDPRSRRNEFLHLLSNVHAPPQRLHLDDRFDGISEDTERLASLVGPERSLNTSSRSSLPLQLLSGGHGQSGLGSGPAQCFVLV